VEAEQLDFGPQLRCPMKVGETAMSYMDTNAAFAPAGGIQELSFDEIEEVGGGPGPLVILAIGAVGYLAINALAGFIDGASGRARQT
jgi:hypothetical protein